MGSFLDPGYKTLILLCIELCLNPIHNGVVINISLPDSVEELSRDKLYLGRYTSLLICVCVALMLCKEDIEENFFYFQEGVPNGDCHHFVLALALSDKVHCKSIIGDGGRFILVSHQLEAHLFSTFEGTHRSYVGVMGVEYRNSSCQ